MTPVVEAVQDGGAAWLAEHVPLFPPDAPQVHAAEFPALGKEGEAGFAEPMLHKAPEKADDPFGYEVAAGPHEPTARAAAWLAVHVPLSPSAAWHDHVEEFPADGKEGETGTAEPTPHKAPEKTVAPFAYALAAGPQEPTTGAARLATHVSSPPAAWHVQVLVPPTTGKTGEAGTAEPTLHKAPAKEVAPDAYALAAGPQEPGTPQHEAMP